MSGASLDNDMTESPSCNDSKWSYLQRLIWYDHSYLSFSREFGKLTLYCYQNASEEIDLSKLHNDIYNSSIFSYLRANWLRTRFFWSSLKPNCLCLCRREKEKETLLLTSPVYHFIHYEIRKTKVQRWPYGYGSGSVYETEWSPRFVSLRIESRH